MSSDRAEAGKLIRRLNADLWNDMRSMVAEWKGTRGLFDGDVGGIAEIDPSRIKMTNNTGSDLARYSVLAIGSPWLDPSASAAALDIFKTRPTARGDIPDEARRGKFAVTVDGCLAGGVVDAVASGIVLAKVAVATGEESYQYADVAVGYTDRLQAVASGSARILRRETGTGLKWALVRLGDNSVSTSLPTARLYGGMSFNSDGSNRNYVKGYDSSESSSDRAGYVFFDYIQGDYANLGLSSVTNRSAVNGGTAETAACFALANPGTYRFSLNINATNNTSVPTATSVANVTASSSGHVHSYTYERDRHYGSSWAMSIQTRLGAGAWVGTSANHENPTQITSTGHSWYGTAPVDWISSDGIYATSDSGREFRVKLYVYFNHDGSFTAGEHAERRVIDGAVLSIARVGDYSAAIAT